MAKIIPVYGIPESIQEKEQLSFYSNRLSDHLKQHQFINTPHKHSTYISILFTDGKGEHLIDFTNYPVNPGSVFLLTPGQVHSWTLSQNAQGYVFFHTKEFYDTIFLHKKTGDFPFFFLKQNFPLIKLKAEHTKKIEALFAEINIEFNQNLPMKMQKIASLVDLVYTELSRSYIKKTESADHSLHYNAQLRELQKLIDLHFKTKKSASDYAEMMNISTRHLGRICKATINSATGDLIIERIILEGKRMLISRDITVSMVADELGYEDYSYFIRVFKKHTGLSPKEFQNKINKTKQ